jgi:hypothetical protein
MAISFMAHARAVCSVLSHNGKVVLLRHTHVRGMA